MVLLSPTLLHTLRGRRLLRCRLRVRAAVPFVEGRRDAARRASVAVTVAVAAPPPWSAPEQRADDQNPEQDEEQRRERKEPEAESPRPRVEHDRRGARCSAAALGQSGALRDQDRKSVV